MSKGLSKAYIYPCIGVGTRRLSGYTMDSGIQSPLGRYTSREAETCTVHLGGLLTVSN